MALAIDTKDMVERWMPSIPPFVFGEDLPRVVDQFQLHRVSAYATVVRDSSAILPMVKYCSKNELFSRGALDWQADPEDDLDDLEVFHHLTQLMAAATGSDFIAKTPQAVSLLATARVPPDSSGPGHHGRKGHGQQALISEFRPFSIKVSMFQDKDTSCYCYGHTDFQKIIKDHRRNLTMNWAIRPGPNIVGIESLPKAGVFWCIQIDLVDLQSSRYPNTQNVGKRRRRSMDPFIRVESPQHEEAIAEPSNHAINHRRQQEQSEAKRFNGVRYRPNRRTWVAEIKPPEARNKVSLGDFKSQLQAARAADVAFHYYGKMNLLNFPDTVSLLPPAPENSVNDVGKLEFVKKEVKRIASIGFTTLPSASGAACNVEILESSHEANIASISDEQIPNNIPSSSSKVPEVPEVYELTLANYLVDVPRPDQVEHSRGSDEGGIHISSTFPSTDHVEPLRSPSFSGTFMEHMSRSPSPSIDSQSGFISLWGYHQDEEQHESFGRE